MHFSTIWFLIFSKNLIFLFLVFIFVRMVGLNFVVMIDSLVVLAFLLHVLIPIQN